MRGNIKDPLVPVSRTIHSILQLARYIGSEDPESRMNTRQECGSNTYLSPFLRTQERATNSYIFILTFANFQKREKCVGVLLIFLRIVF